MEDGYELTLDPNEVQLCQSFMSIDNNINNFIKRKHTESSDRNTRLYNSVLESNNFNSSRTCDTIAAKRLKESECFIRKSKVHNTTGPLCNSGIYLASENGLLSNNTSFNGLKTGLCERISNLESCLNIKSEKKNTENYKTTADIYAKLRSLEDKVLTLQNNMLLQKKGSLIEISNQETLLTEHNSVNEPKTSSVEILPKSKYTAEEIQELIDSIKK